MALRKRKLKDDLLWLRGPFIVLGIAILSAAGMYYGANLFRGEFQQQEMAVQSDFDLLTQQVEEIEQAERIIVENIETYNGMRTNGILDEEDRVALLEDIAAIRS
ncbi:MAG: hypothetical protein RLO18_16460, partial [Gimesia chilikensis]